MGAGGGKLADDESCSSSDLEQEMKAKMMRYFELYLEVWSVGHEQGQPRIFFEAFQSMDDATAAMLNDMVKRYRQDELELKKRGRVIQQELNRAFDDLINKQVIDVLRSVVGMQ